jgi:hypothetical protein
VKVQRVRVDAVPRERVAQQVRLHAVESGEELDPCQYRPIHDARRIGA